MTIKYTNWPQSRTNGNKIYQRLPLQDPPKFTQLGIFGMKIYLHLATTLLMKTDKRVFLANLGPYSEPPPVAFTSQMQCDQVSMIPVFFGKSL
jgi:hypothetical protein